MKGKYILRMWWGLHEIRQKEYWKSPLSWCPGSPGDRKWPWLWSVSSLKGQWEPADDGWSPSILTRTFYLIPLLTFCETLSSPGQMLLSDFHRTIPLHCWSSLFWQRGCFVTRARCLNTRNKQVTAAPTRQWLLSVSVQTAYYRETRGQPVNTQHSRLVPWEAGGRRRRWLTSEKWQ